MRTVFSTAAAILVTAALHAPAAAQNAENFEWSRAVASGRTVQIRGVNGAINAVASSSGAVRVEAKKTSKRSNVEDVKIEVIEHGDGVTLCAVYPTPPRARRPNNCTPGENMQSSVNNNDVVVEWTVHVPRGVKLDARTVNGDVSAQNIQADVHASTVNGDIEASSLGMVRAGTVNGSIDVKIGRAAWDGTLEFETVNGGITVTLPEGTNTSVSASTVNGSMESDFPLTVRGTWGNRSMNGTIGSGGRSLRLSTVNGAIELKKD